MRIVPDALYQFATRLERHGADAGKLARPAAQLQLPPDES